VPQGTTDFRVKGGNGTPAQRPWAATTARGDAPSRVVGKVCARQRATGAKRTKHLGLVAGAVKIVPPSVEPSLSTLTDRDTEPAQRHENIFQDARQRHPGDAE
jgi:hypothetical protein